MTSRTTQNRTTQNRTAQNGEPQNRGRSVHDHRWGGRGRLGMVLLALAVAGLAAGCGGGGDNSGSAAQAAQAPAGDTSGGARSSGGDSGAGSGVAADQGAKAAEGAKAGNASSTIDVTAATGRRVRTVQLTLEVKKLSTAADQVRSTALGFGGVVSEEKSGFTVDGEAMITVRVPETRLDAALTALAKIGKEVDRSASSQDVTATIADLNSRVSSQAASVARVRKLMDRAQTLPDIVLLESELSRRQADLESVQAQARALDDQATFSTVTVSLRTPLSAAGTEPTTTKDDGFLAGFRHGWQAVTASTTVVLTVIGALLPVVVALLVIGWPAALLWRRFAPQFGWTAPPRAPRPGPPATPGPDPTPDTP